MDKKIEITNDITGETKTLRFSLVKNHEIYFDYDQNIVKVDGLSYRMNSNGYLTNGKKEVQSFYKYIHRLLWEIYHDDIIPAGHVIHHIDEDKLNNTKGNLKMMEDSEHRILHATGKTNRGNPGPMREEVKRKISEGLKRSHQLRELGGSNATQRTIS